LDFNDFFWRLFFLWCELSLLDEDDELEVELELSLSLELLDDELELSRNKTVKT
jgi:hypothetical protein